MHEGKGGGGRVGEGDMKTLKTSQGRVFGLIRRLPALISESVCQSLNYLTEQTQALLRT